MSNKVVLVVVVLVAIVACMQAHPSRPNSKFKARPRQVRSLHHTNPARFGIDISKAPYQVSVQYLNSHSCGGSVLSKKWVLTSALCTRGKKVHFLTVRLGSSRHASGGTVIHIERIFKHPKFDDNTLDYDFSLMELETELTFSSVVQPVALPEQDEEMMKGTMATVSGWGATHDTAKLMTVLHAANVPIMSQEDCRDAYSVEAITDRMLCSGYKQGGKNACSEDSGGPLVAGRKLVGVFSWGFFCGLPAVPGVYGRVASVREWVRKTSGV